MRAQTEKTTFTCKDDFLLTKRTRRWTYSALLYFFPAVSGEIIYWKIRFPRNFKNSPTLLVCNPSTPISARTMNAQNQYQQFQLEN